MNTFLVVAATLAVAGCSTVAPPQRIEINQSQVDTEAHDMALKVANETCQAIGKHTQAVLQEPSHLNLEDRTVVLSFSCI